MTIAAVSSSGGGTTIEGTNPTWNFGGATLPVGALVAIVSNGDTTTDYVAGDCTKSAGTCSLGAISLAKAAHSATNTRVGVWWALVTTAGTLTLTIAQGGNNCNIGGEAYTATNGWPAAPVEATNNAAGTTGLTPSSGNATSAGSALMIGGLSVNNGASVTLTPGASFASIHSSLDGTAHVVGDVTKLIVTAGTTAAASWTINPGPVTDTEAVIVVFKESPNVLGKNLQLVGPGISPNKQLLFTTFPLSNYVTPVNATVALTGQTISLSQGTFGITGQDQYIGRSLQMGPGISPDWTKVFDPRQLGYSQTGVTVAITGQSLTISQGTFVPSTAVPITGQALTISQGTLTPATSVAITGQTVTLTQGTVVPSLSVAITGQVVTFSQGTFTTQTDGALTGQVVTINQGTFTVPGDVTVSMTGQGMTIGQGSFGITGQDATGNQGAHPRKRKRYFVEIDGQEFSVSSERQAMALLAKARELVVQSAEKAVAVVDPKIKIGSGIPIPIITTNVKTPQMKAAVVEVKAAYRNAFKTALQAKLKQESEDDDERALLLLL